MVLLQETRATDVWAPQLEDLYARAWGYDPARMPQRLSFWPATPTPAGGVAILLAPDSSIADVSPWNEALWSQYFVAIRGTFDGAPLTVICLYGATKRATREHLFHLLASIDPPEGLVILGGDFNCTLDPELDRSRRSQKSHSSDALSALLVAWGLADAVMDDMLAATTQQEVVNFQAAYHTYMYPVRDTAIATARLDRWYVSLSQYAQVGKVLVAPPVARSDHDSVELQLHARTAPRPSRGKAAPQLRYPLPACAVDAIRDGCHALIAANADRMLQLPAATAALAWDGLKTELRRTSLVIRRRCLTAATARYRARVKRLHRALRCAKEAAATRAADKQTTVESITNEMEALALAPVSRYRAIRRQLIELQTKGTERTRLRRHAVHAGRAHESARAFYRRISTKFCRRTARALPPEPGCTLGAADRVARDWRPVTQRPAKRPETQDEFFSRLPKKSCVPDLSGVDAPISAAEVTAAINACPRGKACGPDGLGNDWYRDHVDSIAPILAALFTSWYAASVLPSSFVAASVFCVPKSSTPTSGLDFRPIALLNTDYKLFSRVLLHRIRAHTPTLVSQTQYGFVHGRQVHDAVDVWTALQSKATAGLLPEGAMAVFLDFAKAYDSLDRRFLSLALRRHGFSPLLVSAVDAMHLGTTATYVTEGQTSAVEDVSTGIRQGCPFAPTLFILAVDVLYELTDRCVGLPGLPLTETVGVSLVGFADDTTAYLQSPTEAAALLSLLHEFSAVSGLSINATKSVAVCLTESGASLVPADFCFPVAAPSQLVRYLGIQISTIRNLGAVWDTALQQLRARLILAAIKTTDLLQRVQVCSAIILPKILFVARHSWPTAAIVKRLQRFVHNYAWHGVLLDDGIQRRAWMSAPVAAASRADGGLQLPNVHESLMVLSAKTVVHWLSTSGLVSAAVGQLLSTPRAAASQRVAPGRGPCPRPRLHASMATSGRGILRAAATRLHEDDERAAIVALLPTAGKAPLSRGEWVRGWYQRDYGREHGDLIALRKLQRSRYGRLNVACLLATPVVGCGLLLHSSGRQLKATDLPGIPCGAATVGDIVEIAWVSSTVLRFRQRAVPYPYPSPAASSFRLLCDTLVMSYPELLLPHDPPAYLTERTQSKDVWFLEQKPTGVHLVRDVSTHERYDLGVVTSIRHAEAAARQATARRLVRFAPHPLLSAVVPLWGSSAQFATHRLRQFAVGAASLHADRELEARGDRAFAQSERFASALDAVDWNEIHRLPNSSSRQRLMFHKLKGLRLSGWDALHDRRGCPHCRAAGPAGGDAYHIMWLCPCAQRLWDIVRAWWSRLGLWAQRDTTTDCEFFTAVFSLRLPRTPPKVWEWTSLSQCLPSPDDAPEGPYPAFQAAWQQIVLETMLVIIGWRNGMVDPARAWTRQRAAAIHTASCQRVLATLAHRYDRDRDSPELPARLVRDFSASIAETSPPTQEPAPSSEFSHVLFFDGGSRGNPGPGGAGACVVRVDPTTGSAAVVWSSAMSLAHPATTNNQAEYSGLITGLRAALHHTWANLEVVGDSALILTQLRHYRPPKNLRLRRLYAVVRRLADQLGVRRWTHHLRAFNTMADHLANHAMDHCHSSQVPHPTARPGHADIHAFLTNDLHPWLAAFAGRQVD